MLITGSHKSNELHRLAKDYKRKYKSKFVQ